MIRGVPGELFWSLRVPISASPRCLREPTAWPAVPSARASTQRSGNGLPVIIAAMIWPMIGAACPAATADLDAPMTATWSGIGLREWASRVGDTAGLPVIVDRRLDPDATIRLECRDEPLLDVLERGAAVAGGEVATLASSIRIVPRGMAAVPVRAEAARVARMASLPARQRSVLDKQMVWQWPAGTRPRDLVAAAATEAGISLEGIGLVPHDHLPAMSLPEMTLAEGLDMLLCPFDLRVDWQAASATASSPASRVLTGRIIAIDAGLPASADGTAAASREPARRESGKSPGRRAPEGPKSAVGKQTFSLQVAAPLEELLAAITARLGLKLDLDRESLTRSGIAPGEIVRATVKEASRDELLDAILDPLDLTWKIDGAVLRVFAEPRP